MEKKTEVKDVFVPYHRLDMSFLSAAQKNQMPPHPQWGSDGGGGRGGEV